MKKKITLILILITTIIITSCSDSPYGIFTQILNTTGQATTATLGSYNSKLFTVYNQKDGIYFKSQEAGTPKKIYTFNNSISSVNTIRSNSNTPNTLYFISNSKLYTTPFNGDYALTPTEITISDSAEFSNIELKDITFENYLICTGSKNDENYILLYSVPTGNTLDTSTPLKTYKMANGETYLNFNNINNSQYSLPINQLLITTKTGDNKKYYAFNNNTSSFTELATLGLINKDIASIYFKPSSNSIPNYYLLFLVDGSIYSYNIDSNFIQEINGSSDQSFNQNIDVLIYQIPDKYKICIQNKTTNELIVYEFDNTILPTQIEETTQINKGFWKDIYFGSNITNLIQLGTSLSIVKTEYDGEYLLTTNFYNVSKNTVDNGTSTKL